MSYNPETLKIEKCDILYAIKDNLLAIQHNIVGVKKYKNHKLFYNLQDHSDAMMDDVLNQLKSGNCKDFHDG